MPEEKKVVKGYGVPVDPPKPIIDEDHKIFELDKSLLISTEEAQAKNEGTGNNNS